MKVKLTQEGFESYTGQMGVHFFENGMSTSDMSFRDSARMAAVMNCEYEDGTNCSPSQRILDTKLMEADSTRDTYDEPAADAPKDPVAQTDVLTKVDVDPSKGIEGEDASGSSDQSGQTDADPLAAAARAIAAADEQREQKPLWTAEELGQVADKEGIAGLRAIAEPLNVKSNSIANLITALLAANAKKE